MTLDRMLAAVAAGEPQPVYLFHGDLVLAEPTASRLAAAVAAKIGCAVESHRRPARLEPILDDLRTFSLFSPGKVVVATETAVLADTAAAAELVAQACEVLGSGREDGDLTAREREGASRLLQVLRLFAILPEAPDAIDRLPSWAFEGRRSGGGGKGKAKAAGGDVREGLATLLRRALAAGLVGWAEGDVAQLAAIVAAGLPKGNVLVLVESAVDSDHPLVATLRERGAILALGRVEADRKGWIGLEPLARELERETGTAISQDALRELVRRTLRKSDDSRGTEVDADSTARLAGEYRKLAGMSGGARIERALVEEAVEDRGEEDLWALLDEIAAGEERTASERLRRFVTGASDPTVARLGFFSTLAGFCRQLVALGGMMQLTGVAPGERKYDRFRDALAPRLQAELPGGGRSPLQGLHPFRLHRAYLAASRLPKETLLSLPWLVLETELALKGEGGDPDAALARLVGAVAGGGAARR